MSYNALFFDLDNTLLDFTKSEELSLDTVYDEYFQTLVDRDTFKHHYRAINRKLWEQVEGGTLPTGSVKFERFRQLIEVLNADLDHKKIAHQYEYGLVIHADWYPGVKETLYALKKIYRLAVITNGFGNLQDAKCHKLEIPKICDCYVVSEDVGVAKPDKAIFDFAFKKMNLNSGSALMIGDSLASDYLGAQNANLDFCWINPHELKLPEVLSKPKYIIHSVADLPKAINVDIILA